MYARALSELKTLGDNAKSTGFTVAKLTLIVPTSPGIVTSNGVIVGVVTLILIAGAAGILGGTISGLVIIGAANGVFTCGFTVGTGSSGGSLIFGFIGFIFFVTSFGETFANISTSLIGSLISFKFTKPHLLLPLVEESIELSFCIFTPPLELLFAICHEDVLSFPGVIGFPFVLIFSATSIAFFTFQFPLL